MVVMARDVWRKLGERFLTRVVVPLSVVFLVVFVLELWTMRAQAQAERAKPYKPPIERRGQDAPAKPRLGRDFTKSALPATRDST
jgi:hypothetical protein